MASVLELTDNDVPGAKFTYSFVDQHSVVQLKRWLECHGLPTKGNKPDLIKRCQDAVDVGTYGIVPSIDGGKWYDKKVKDHQSNKSKSCNDIPFMPVLGWKIFPSVNLPEFFNHGSTYHYMIETAVVNDAMDSDDGEDIHTVKPLTKGDTLFKSGHVKSLFDCKKGNFYFVKAKVQASYSQVDYDVTITISDVSGVIKDASCVCKASALGRCAHVAAVLIALEDFIATFGYSPVSCTSKLCEWNKGRTSRKEPKVLREINYSLTKNPKRRRKSVMDVQSLDPRPPTLQVVESHDGMINQFVRELMNAHDPSGTHTMWQTLLEITYDDYEICASRLAVLDTLSHSFVSNLANIANGRSEPFEVQGTEGQHINDEWHRIRYGRITASICKDVSQVTRRGIDKLTKHLLWDVNDLHTVIAIKYGRENESIAAETYEGEMKKVHTNFQTEETGFWINPDYPQLGASPDLIVIDPGMPNDCVGLAEIKCPKLLENVTFHDAPVKLNNVQKRNFFCTFECGKLVLKTNHKYYYQVQMQMGICKKNWCDFIVWTPTEVSVERISFDSAFWNGVCCKLVQYHANIMVPEYFEMRSVRHLKVLDLELERKRLSVAAQICD